MRGRRSINGFDVAAQPAEVRESISLTGQFAAVDEILSGRENLVLVARLRHLKHPGAIADELLARFSLADAGAAAGRDLLGRHAPPARHRHEPDRRPAGHLPRRADHRPRPAGAPRGLGMRSSELAGQGTTVLLTTQYLDEAEQLADRIAILHEGRIIANGTLAELKKLLPAGHGRVRREAADPGGRVPRHRRRTSAGPPPDGRRHHGRSDHDHRTSSATPPS